jgi:hypothetical protein
MLPVFWGISGLYNTTCNIAESIAEMRKIENERSAQV